MGDPLDEATDVGSLINQKQYDRVCGYIADGLGNGAKPIVGGLPEGERLKGYFVEPTVFTQVDPAWRIVREEIFGPVLVAIPWSDEDRAIELANDTHYGLSAYVWCRDISRAIRAANRIDAGSVQINRGGGRCRGRPVEASRKAASAVSIRSRERWTTSPTARASWLVSTGDSTGRGAPGGWSPGICRPS